MADLGNFARAVLLVHIGTFLNTPSNYEGEIEKEERPDALEKYPKTPMSHKEILRIIQEEGLKEINGTTPLACLNAMLHSNSRGEDSLFYKVAGKMGVYGLKSDLPEGVERFYQDDSEPESSQTDTSVSDGQAAPIKGKEKRKGAFITRREIDLSRPLCSIVSTRCGLLFTGPAAHLLCVKLPEDELAAATAILNTPAAAAMRQHHEHSYTAIPGTSYQPGASNLSPSKVGSSHSKHHHHHSKRSLKHGMKHSHKRRKKGSKDIPRLILKPVTPPGDAAGSSSQFPSFKEYTSASSTLSSLTASTQSQTSQAPTLTSLLSSLPGLSRKPRRRSQKKLPPAAPIDLTKSGNIDVETPDSIFVNTNLRALVNKHTFASLPPSYQYQLLLQLPECDRQIGGDGTVKLSSTALSNEFFTRACLDWKERLADGEFTPEMQLRLKQEEEKERAKLDPWKEKHYEAFWGQNSPQSSPSKKQKPIPSTASLLQDLSIPTAGLLNTALSGTSYTSGLRSLSVAQSLIMAAQKSPAEQHTSLSVANQMAAATGSASASLAAIGLEPSVLQSGAVAQQQGASQQHGLYGEPPTKRKVEMVKQIVPEKRPKLTQPSIGAPQKPVSQPRTLAQIKAQTQAKVVGRPVQGQTRTLAQIKAQTAAKQQGGAKTLAQIKAQTQALRAANQQGRTRTLAEIKAQTKAKLQARTHTQMQGKLQAPVGAALHVSPTSPNRTGLMSSSPGQPRVAMPQQLSTSVAAAGHTVATVTEPKTTVPFSAPGSSVQLTHQVAGTPGHLTSQTEAAAHSGPADSRLSVPQAPQKVAEESLSQPLVDRSHMKNITLVELITGKPPSDKPTGKSTTTDTSSRRPSTLEVVPQTSEAFNVKSSQFPAKLLEASSPADSISSSGSVSSERSAASVHSLPPHGGSRTLRASKVSSHYLLSSSTQALKHQLRDIAGKARSVAARQRNQDEPERASSAPPVTGKFCENEVENIRAASVASVPVIADVYENGQASCATQGSNLSADTSLTHVNRPVSNSAGMLTPVQVAATADSSGVTAPPGFVNTQHVGVPVSFVGFPNVVRLPQGAALPQHIQVPQGMIQSIQSNQVHVGGGVMQQINANNVAAVQNAAGGTVAANCVGPNSNNSGGHGAATTNAGSKCSCRLKAMVMCKSCGAFCHDDCIGPSRLCVTCLIK
ncbi:putative Polycomb group protein asxl2 [Branchiostoma belcheri]|nr:putative Polycomb group protein asxl2 [Branchiostoma belcheri]